MVVPATCEVADVGGPAMAVGHQVVGVTPVGWGIAAGEDAAPVSGDEPPTLGAGGEPLVGLAGDGVAVRRGDDPCDGGIARQELPLAGRPAEWVAGGIGDPARPVDRALGGGSGQERPVVEQLTDGVLVEVDGDGDVCGGTGAAGAARRGRGSAGDEVDEGLGQ